MPDYPQLTRNRKVAASKVLALALVGILFLSACSTVGRFLSPQQIWASEFTIRGVVVENNLGCTLDVACFLRVEANDSVVTVVYHYGEWPPCQNEAATEFGLRVGVGANVEIFGRLESDGSFSTCDSPYYYIRSLTP